MKKIVLPSLLCLFSAVSYAGSADIPNWQTSSIEYSCFRIANTGPVSSEVVVNLYQQDGAEYTGGIGSNYLISSLGNAFEIPSRSTAYFCVNNTSSLKIGYGKITAKNVQPNTGDTRIIATGYYQVVSSDRMAYTININDSKPF